MSSGSAPIEIRRYIELGLEEDIKSRFSLLEGELNARRIELLENSIKRIKVAYEFYASQFLPVEELEKQIEELSEKFKEVSISI
jgi:cupin superfamily acireductone dioxygenase involved in methionine salvage